MAGLFVWMKQGRVYVPGEASSQAADSVDKGAEVDEAIPEVGLNIMYKNCKWCSMWFSFVNLNSSKGSYGGDRSYGERSYGDRSYGGNDRGFGGSGGYRSGGYSSGGGGGGYRDNRSELSLSKILKFVLLPGILKLFFSSSGDRVDMNAPPPTVIHLKAMVSMNDMYL